MHSGENQRVWDQEGGSGTQGCGLLLRPVSLPAECRARRRGHTADMDASSVLLLFLPFAARQSEALTVYRRKLEFHTTFRVTNTLLLICFQQL